MMCGCAFSSERQGLGVAGLRLRVFALSGLTLFFCMFYNVYSALLFQEGNSVFFVSVLSITSRDACLI